MMILTGSCRRDEKRTNRNAVLLWGFTTLINKVQFQQAVRSIINQTFQQWEMLIYDDGSDERYIPVIEKTAKLDKRIRLIRNEKNHGLAYGLNECLKQAKGRYIARMDDDDISMPDRLEKLYGFLENHREYQWAGSNWRAYR